MVMIREIQEIRGMQGAHLVHRVRLVGHRHLILGEDSDRGMASRNVAKDTGMVPSNLGSDPL